jgi:hypothetical protein
MMQRILVLLALLVPISTFAENGSGACSYHDGVNCSAGWQSDGIVICNDGWKESVVEYEFVEKCENSTTYSPMDYAIRNHTYIMHEQNIPEWSVVNQTCMQNQYQNARYIERVSYCSQYTQSVIDNAIRFPSCPSNSEKISDGRNLEDYFCRCIEGYYNYPTPNGDQGFCSQGSPSYLNAQESIEPLNEAFVEKNVTSAATLEDDELPDSEPSEVSDLHVIQTELSQKLDTSGESENVSSTEESWSESKNKNKIDYIIIFLLLVLLLVAGANGIRLIARNNKA